MKIRELLNNSYKWTKGAYARNKYGFECSYKDNAASCFCLVGALKKCYAHDLSTYKICMTKIFEKITGQTNCYKFKLNKIIEFNDSENTKFDNIKQLVEELNI